MRSLMNLKVSVPAQFSWKYSPESRTLVQEKCGPLGSNSVVVTAGGNGKILPKAAALILIGLEMDAELDEVPTMTSSPSVIFL